jgi:hypothetical protein
MFEEYQLSIRRRVIEIQSRQLRQGEDVKVRPPLPDFDHQVVRQMMDSPPLPL